VYKRIRRRFERRRLGSMFERFTERARKAVVLAQEDAELLRHNYIGTEHLLLGLLREDEGVAARALAALGVTVEETRERVESIVGYGTEGPGPQVPFTPRSKKVLELALRESMQLGHNYIGTEHILLGLVRENEGVAARVLSDIGVSPVDVRRELLRMLSGGPPSDVRHLLFRGKLLAFEAHARYGSVGERIVPQPPRTLLVELDYSYSVQETEDLLLGTVDPGDLREGVVRVLEGEEFVLLEAGIVRTGEYILQEFPTVQEITVSVTIRQEPEVTVSRTFRR
jgi:ATP-dependent Clp protease ATP-binding subunit ClpA